MDEEEEERDREEEEKVDKGGKGEVVDTSL